MNLWANGTPLNNEEPRHNKLAKTSTSCILNFLTYPLENDHKTFNKALSIMEA